MKKIIIDRFYIYPYNSIVFLKVIFISVILFLFFLVIHIILFRKCKPLKTLLSIFTVFLIIPTIVFISVLVFTILIHAFLSIEELLLTALLYFGLACFYIQTFPAFQANPPTLQLILLIGNAKNGISEEEIMRNYSEDELVNERIKDLITDGLIKDDFTLTKSGKILVRFFDFYNKLIGIKQGDG